jgi:hypothetical protein
MSSLLQQLETPPSMGIELALSNGQLRGEQILAAPVLSTMWSQIFEITPEMAREILRFQPSQRMLYPTTVAHFAALIRDGDFQTTHQGIAFDERGELSDGQHRLTACVETGIPIRVMVSFNVPRATFEAVDGGRTRSVADHLFTGKLVGDMRIAGTISAAGRVLHSWDRGLDPTVKDPGRGAGAKQIRLAMGHHPLLRDTCEWCLANRGDRRVQHLAAFAALLTVFREVNDGRAMHFADQVVNGESIAEGDPAHTLRKAMQPERKTLKNRAVFMYRLTWAWNAFYRGEKPTYLLAGPSRAGGFPKIAGHPSAKAK